MPWSRITGTCSHLSQHWDCGLLACWELCSIGQNIWLLWSSVRCPHLGSSAHLGICPMEDELFYFKLKTKVHFWKPFQLMHRAFMPWCTTPGGSCSPCTEALHPTAPQPEAAHWEAPLPCIQRLLALMPCTWKLHSLWPWIWNTSSSNEGGKEVISTTRTAQCPNKKSTQHATCWGKLLELHKQKLRPSTWHAFEQRPLYKANTAPLLEKLPVPETLVSEDSWQKPAAEHSYRL
jgi:hypothetical protein